MLTRLESKTLAPHASAGVLNPKSAILLLCLLAFALRLGPAFDNRFHPDEALFSSWALKIASGENVLLSGVPVDKPPLLIYATAISFFFFGQTETAARLPNLAASVISVALIYWLAVGQLGNWSTTRPIANYQLTNRPVNYLTILPSLLLTFSPFAILFAPTAFLDPTMVMFGLASLVAALRGRAGWAGILLGLSFATKVQGLFFAPLTLVYWSTSQLVNQGSGIRDQRSEIRDQSRRLSVSLSLVRFLAAFLTIALIVLAWDRLRGGLPFWEQQSINYGGIRVIYPSEAGPRLTGWLALLPYFFGPLVGLIGLIGLPILVWFDLTRAARTRAAWIDLILIAWLFALFGLHWLLAFPVWDRYFLMLVPIATLLVGRVIGHLVNWLTDHLVTPSVRHLVSLSLLLLIILALPFSLVAAGSGYPIGGDHGGYDGIDQVAGYLRTLPSGAVVYDHWLAWELDYYLGEGHVYVAYFDTPAALADDLRAFGHNGDRYVVFPANESPDKAIEAIAQAGFMMSPIYTTQNRFNQTAFTLFRIQAR